MVEGLTMPLINASTGGGSSLNFDVKAYANTGSLPSSGVKENTIGVITTDPITGWTVDSVQPLVTTAGHVWVRTAINSTARPNVIKKNSLNLSLVGIYQYQSGYAYKEAYIWQGNTWIPIASFLFQDGVISQIAGDFSWNNGGSITPTYIELTSAGSANRVVMTDLAIDLTPYSLVKFRCTTTNTSFSAGIYTDSSISSPLSVSTVISLALGTNTVETDKLIDVSGLSGNYKIGFSTNGSTGYTCRMYAILLV